MRRRDKLKNIERVNLLAEQRYLESKGVLKEEMDVNTIQRNLASMFTFDFQGQRHTIGVRDVVRAQFGRHKDLNIDVVLEDNNILGNKVTITVGNKMEYIFILNKGRTTDCTLVGDTKSWLLRVREMMLEQQQGTDENIQEDESEGGDEQRKIELVLQMTKEMGSRLASEIKKMGIDGNGYQMGIKGEGLGQYLEITFNTDVVDYESQFKTLETGYLNHLKLGLVKERGLGGEYEQYVNTGDQNTIKWQIKYTPPEQLQGGEQQGGDEGGEQQSQPPARPPVPGQ